MTVKIEGTIGFRNSVNTEVVTSNAKVIDELINTTKPSIAASLSIRIHSTAEVTIEKANVTSVDSTACRQRCEEESNEELCLAYGVDIASPCPSGVAFASSDGIESDFSNIVLGSNDNVSTFDLVFYSAVSCTRQSLCQNPQPKVHNVSYSLKNRLHIGKVNLDINEAQKR